MKQIYGEVIDNVPVVIFTDSKNLYEAVHSSSLVDDSWLIIDVAIIKDALKDDKHVSSEWQVGICWPTASLRQGLLLNNYFGCYGLGTMCYLLVWRECC